MMKRLLFILGLFISIASAAQVPTGFTKINQKYAYLGIIADSVLGIPIRDTAWVSPAKVGEMRYRQSDSTIYICIRTSGAGKKWQAVGSGVGGGAGGGLGAVYPDYGLISVNDSTIRVDSSWNGLLTKADAIRQYDSVKALNYRRKLSTHDYNSYEASPYLMSAQWELRNDTVWGDHWRDGPWALSLNDTLFVGNGWYNNGISNHTTDSILYSVDGGVTYTYYGDMPMEGHSITVIQSPDGYIYFCGNDNDATSTERKSVWRTRNLREFTLMTDDWEIGDRMLTGGFADDEGRLYILGGQTSLSDSSTGKYDVWRSVNGGANWTKIQENVSNQFLRGNINGAVVFTNRRVYVVGGGLQSSTGAQRTFRNSVYSISIDDIENGSAWKQEADMPYAAQYKGVIEWDGKIWAIGGNTVSGNSNNVAFMDKAGVWHTYNSFVGVKPTDATFAATHAAALAVHKGLLYQIGGNTTNYTYRMRRSNAEFPEGIKQIVGPLMAGNEGKRAWIGLNLDDSVNLTPNTFLDLRAHTTTKTDYAQFYSNANIGMRLNSIDNTTGLTGFSLNNQHALIVGHSGNTDGFAGGIGFYQFGTNYVPFWLRANGHVSMNFNTTTIPTDVSPLMVGGLENNGGPSVKLVAYDTTTGAFFTQNMADYGWETSYPIYVLDGGDNVDTLAVETDAWDGLALKEWVRDTLAGLGSGSGTVNSGTANRLAYYPSSSAAVDDLAAITANRLLISDANGLPTHSSVTNTEAGYLSGVTSAIQTQINGKIGQGIVALTDDWDIRGTGTYEVYFNGLTAFKVQNAAEFESSVTFDSYVDFANASFPSAPSAGKSRISFNDELLYWQNGDGYVTTISSPATTNVTMFIPASANSTAITLTDYAKVYTLQTSANPTGTVTFNGNSGGQYHMTFTGSGGRTLAFSNITSGFQGVVYIDNTSGGTVTLTLPSNAYVMNTSGVYASAASVTVPQNKCSLSLALYDGTNYWFITSW